MDDKTHIIMAYKLLETCDCDKSASIYSLVPSIDRKPAHLHRLYGHVLTNVQRIANAAIAVLSDPEVSLMFKGGALSYELRRCIEEKDYFRELLDDANNTIGDESIKKPSGDLVSVFVAILSHIYFDTFNNPVQAFLPECSYCSGQWDFWSEVDYFKFRGEFYSEKIIAPFRERILNDTMWDVELDPVLFDGEVQVSHMWDKNLKLNPFALINAMVIRLGELAKPEIEYSVVDWRARDLLDYTGCTEYHRADKEIAFLTAWEKKMTSLMLESIS